MKQRWYCTRDDVIALSRVNDQVYFDLDRVFEFREAVGMEFDANLLHFICTHPSGFAGYSKKDENCMRELTDLFEHPVLFSVVIPDYKNKYSTDYWIGSFYWLNDMVVAIEKPFHLSYEQLLLLQILSEID
jgi:hypothetical protein